MDEQEELNITRPDADLFETASEAGRQKRQISDRQRLHLQKARIKAKEKMQERKELEKRIKEEEERKKEKERIPSRREVIYEEEEDDGWNSEEEDVALFGNWMKHMSRYKEFKSNKKQKERESKEREQQQSEIEAERRNPPPPPTRSPEPEILTKPPSPQMIRYTMSQKTRHHRGVRIR